MFRKMPWTQQMKHCVLAWALVWGTATWAKAEPLPTEDPGPMYVSTIQQWAKVTNFAYNAATLIVEKIERDLDSNPKLKSAWQAGLKQDLLQYFYEVFYAPETTLELAKIYAQHLTLDDMLDILKFYKSPVGQKLVKVDPQLRMQTEQLGAQLLKKHENAYLVIVGKYIKPKASDKK